MARLSAEALGARTIPNPDLGERLGLTPQETRARAMLLATHVEQVVGMTRELSRFGRRKRKAEITKKLTDAKKSLQTVADASGLVVEQADTPFWAKDYGVSGRLAVVQYSEQGIPTIEIGAGDEVDLARIYSSNVADSTYYGIRRGRSMQERAASVLLWRLLPVLVNLDGAPPRKADHIAIPVPA